MEINLDRFRARILNVAHLSGEGHIPSALSILEIVWALYVQVMGLRNGEFVFERIAPNNWTHPDCDRFVLSKGHGCLALYAMLEAMEFITAVDMAAFCKPGGILGGHPDANKIPGVWASTGSLGHGLPFAVGMAYAKRIRNEGGRVFCLVGDGEMQEGSSIEALRLARDLDVSNLCIIVDANGTHGKLGPLLAVLRGYEFHVRMIAGNNVLDATSGVGALALAFGSYSTYPVAVVAKTVKGHGVKMIEKDPQAWHRRTPTFDELGLMLEGLAT